MEKYNNQLPPVKFYRKNQQFGQFSNFFSSPIEENGIKYPTNQHYFQSKKFEGHPYEFDIAQAPKPLDAFNMGQNRKIPIRKDWNQVKQKVMYHGLKLKFTQNPKLKQILLSTGQRQLIEHTQKDSYWGDGKANGKNRLGFLLMDLRDQFQNNQKK